MTKKKKPKPLTATTPPKGQPIAVHQSFSGPIPAPDLLRQYDTVIPGAAERILSMAERDAKHQQDIEQLAIKYATSETRRGQWFGLIIGVCALVMTAISLAFGSENTAMVIGGSTIVGLVTVFVVGRTSTLKDSPPAPK